MMSNIDQRTLSKHYAVRVRDFPGAMIDDMLDYLRPVLKKNADKILLVIGTNNLRENGP